MKTITVVNYKGGVAKTTTVANVGILLARDYKQRVLLVDYDGQGNLSSWLNVAVPSDSDVGTPVVMRDKDYDIHDAIRKTDEPGLSVLPCNETIATALTSIRADNLFPQQNRLQMQLAKVKDEYDYVLIDSPFDAADIRTINAMYASQEVIIVTTTDKDSYEAVKTVLAKVKAVQYMAPYLSPRGVLFTSVEPKKNTSRAIMEDAEEDSDIAPLLFRTYIRRGADAEKAKFFGCCIRDCNARSNPAIDYDNFLAEYMGHRPMHKDAPYCKKGRWFG